MAEPIAALIVRILADTSEMVTGVKNVSGQLDAFENRVTKMGKVIAGVFTATAIAGFAREIMAEVSQIDTAAKKVGTSSEEFQRFSYAVKQTGGEIDGAINAVVSLTDKFSNGDAGLLAVLKKLNIGFDEFKAKDPVQRFISLAGAINSVTDPTKQLELRLEALGTKGVAALTAVDSEFATLAKNAPTYSDETIKALKRVEDGWDALWAKVKVGAAESAVALKDFLDFSKTQFFDENGAPKFIGGSGDVRDNPTPRPGNNLPPALGFGGVDPNDPKALAVALADLDLKYSQVAAAAKRADDEWDQQIFILKALKIEAPSVADALDQLMAKMGTTTKVEQMTQRILDLAMRTRDLRLEQEQLMEAINPGSTQIAGDDTDKAIFDLRSDPRNFGPDGNLTPQALEIETLLIQNANLRSLRNTLRPASPTAVPSSFGSVFPGQGAGLSTNITINAQGGWWDSPDRINQMARLVEDSIAKRSGLANTYTRR